MSERKVLACPKLPTIATKCVTLGTQLKIPDDAASISELYNGTLNGLEGHADGVAVWVKQFHSAANIDYQQERDSTARIVSMPGLKECYVNIYGCNDDNRWIVMEAYDGFLDDRDAMEALGPTDGSNYISNRRPLRIALDAAKYITLLHQGIRNDIAKAKEEKCHMYDSIVLHRDIKASNIVLVKGWKHAINNPGLDKKDADLPAFERFDKLPTIARIGPFGAPTTRSKNFRSGSVGDLYHLPPDTVADGYEYHEQADIWRFGILLYEIWTREPWEKLIEADRHRVIITRLKPKESKHMQDVYNERWLGQPQQGGAPATYYEIVQVGTWQIDQKRRPPADIIHKCIKWCLEDAYIERKYLPPRPETAPKTMDVDKVIEHLGFNLFPPPPAKLFISQRSTVEAKPLFFRL